MNNLFYTLMDYVCPITLAKLTILLGQHNKTKDVLRKSIERYLPDILYDIDQYNVKRLAENDDGSYSIATLTGKEKDIKETLIEDSLTELEKMHGDSWVKNVYILDADHLAAFIDFDMNLVKKYGSVKIYYVHKSNRIHKGILREYKEGQEIFSNATWEGKKVYCNGLQICLSPPVWVPDSWLAKYKRPEIKIRPASDFIYFREKW